MLDLAARPVVARAQQPAMPIGFLTILSSSYIASRMPSFRQGLKEAGYIQGQNVAIEYRLAEQGVQQFLVSCLRCQHEVLIDVSSYWADTTVPSFLPRMKCPSLVASAPTCGQIGRNGRWARA